MPYKAYFYARELSSSTAKFTEIPSLGKWRYHITCDVGSWTQDAHISTSNMASASPQRKRKKGGKYCACGVGGKVSCNNSCHVKGISMHSFPEDEKVRKCWVKFVRKHVPTFKVTKSSVLCSAHFEKSCYDPVYFMDIPEELKPRARYLLPGSVPTLDTVNQATMTPITSREKRKVSYYNSTVHTLCTAVCMSDHV